MAEYSKETTFWYLLQDKKVIIPIIQRDYAQGRLGQEYLRQRFLEKLFGALTTDGDKRLFLDFVYGSTELDKIYPLDGQQRLTTLWLIHWYLALVCGELSKCRETLKKFSYQTRTSSRSFCEHLCDINTEYNYEDEATDIISFIRNQNWFYLSYEQDPTIQSMMYMLGGTDIDDKDGNDIVDGIEEMCRFKMLTRCDIRSIWDLLISSSCPIRFYLLNMEDKNMPLTDDLYIKMNARGKILTDFENFKVDLLDYKIDDKESLIIEKNADENSFSHKLDTDWTDLFWCNRSSDDRIDGIMMKFFYRFFLDWYFANGSQGKKPEEITSEPFFKNMTDSNKSYQNISVFAPALTKEAIGSLTKCLNGLFSLYATMGKDFEAINRVLQPYWNESVDNDSKKRESTFYFIPKYLQKEQNEEISKITFQQRVVFHAVRMYLENISTPDSEGLAEWLHFVWNIVENSYIDREQAITAIRFFETELAKLSKIDIKPVQNIRLFLSSINEDSLPADVFGKRQLLEEIAKSKKYYIDGNLDLSWKQKIEDAEKVLFFKGAIAFLFNDEKGTPCDWNNFDTKLETAKRIFDKNGLVEDCRVNVMCRLYQLCTDFDYQLWWSRKVFNATASTWKDNILVLVDKYYNYVYASNVHHILMNDEYIPEIADHRILAISDPKFVSFLLGKNGNDREMYIRWPHYALHFCGERQGILLDFKRRDKVLSDILSDSRFMLRDKSNAIEGTDMFWGFDIDFIFNDNGKKTNLRWYRERNENAYDIYLMDESWNWLHRPAPIDSERGDRKTCYCFNVEENISINSLVSIINEQMPENQNIE